MVVQVSLSTKTLKTRTRYMLVGSDFSAQEPRQRLTAFMSQDPKMIQAYLDGKDLYAVIAQSMFNNEYHENLEFWPEWTEVELDGKILVSGSGKEKTYTLDATDSFEVPYFYLLPTPSGDVEASLIQIGEKILTDTGELDVLQVEPIKKDGKKYIKLTLKIC